MIKEDKRALSTIVSTLLILLLVFVAIGILWSVVRTFIQSGSEEISLGKFTLDLQIDSVVINSTNGTMSVRVVRGTGDGDFTGLRFIMDDGDTTQITEVRGVNMAEQDKQTFTFAIPSGMSASTIQTVSIAPIFTLSSGEESNGDIKDTWTNSGF